MRHRVFIAINLPENVKNQLSSLQSKWPEVPAKWTKKQNLHITLIFLGYVKDEELPDILKIARETASKNEPFSINLKKICYGPTDKKPPRMIWAEGEKSSELAKLQRDLENELSGTIPQFEKDYNPPAASSRLRRAPSRAFAPHITLARIKLWEFRKVEPEERPEISEEISLNFDVNSIETMESVLKPKGPDYFVLESATIGKK